MEQLKAQFLNPAGEYRALPMSFDQAKPKECAAQMVEGKWGGAVFNYPHGGPGYLHEKGGWDSFSAAVQACKEKGLQVWIYDEHGYPSGSAGGQTLKDHPEFEAQGLFYDSIDVVAREKKEVEWTIPEGKPFFVAVCPLWVPGVLGGPTDITDKVKDGKVSITVEPGSWRLMAFVQNRLYEGTHAPITFGPYLNVMDPKAVRRFIEITHESFYSHCGREFGKTVTAFFNDEASVMGGFLSDEPQPHPALSWYDGLPTIFKQRNGYDIREALPGLFNDIGQDTVRKRCDFYSTVAQTVADSYFGQIESWCAAHNVASTGHLLWEESLLYHVPFYGSMFPSLAKFDWPGIDVLGCNYGCTSGARTEGGPVTPKLISSVAHLYGKKRTMSESFCFVTNKTPVEDLLAHIAWQWALGINSLVTLSIQEQFEPEDFRRLNDFTGRLSWMLTQGRFTADVAVLYPIASAWADFTPTNRHVSYLLDNPKAKEVDDAWREVSKELLARRRDFDYVAEENLENARVASGALRIGENKYSILVLPHVTTLKYSTLKRIEEFVKGGGTVISFETLPTNREDAGPADEFQRLVDKLWDSKRIIHVETMHSLDAALEKCGPPDVRITPSTKEVYYQHRVLEEGDIYFLVNNSIKPVSGKFEFPPHAGKAEVWNPINGEMKQVPVRKNAIDLTLPPRNGLFVVFS